eukprot:COSAG06_NODE_50642_length_317_cov_0.926606_1_plen_69_part_01
MTMSDRKRSGTIVSPVHSKRSSASSTAVPGGAAAAGRRARGATTQYPQVLSATLSVVGTQAQNMVQWLQ